MPKLLISHPTGNANVRAAVIAFKKNNLLYKFYTSIAVFQGTFLFYLSKLKPFALLQRRVYDPSLRDYTRQIFLKEVGRNISLKIKLKKLVKHEVGFFSVDSVYRNQDSKIANYIRRKKKINFNGVYAYEDVAHDTFIEAKKRGITTIYELPIPYYRHYLDILELEKKNNPDWSITLTGLKNSPSKLARKDKELENADWVIVANSFTAKSLLDFPGKKKKVLIIPYGFPKVNTDRVYNQDKNRKLKLLFVGGLTQQKGISYLFDAVNSLEDKVELTIVGRKSIDNCEILNENLAKHTWIPYLLHADVLKLMRDSDVLVFPSLFEGFGMVITEAMAQGTPVIATDRTAALDFIEDSKNGWLVPPGDAESIVQKLLYIIKNPQCIEKVGRAAMETAKCRPWQQYEDELAVAINSLLKNG